MSPSDTTCWTVIRGAAEGGRRERETFARRYEPVIRAYLGVRWRRGGRLDDLDDAVQEVFVDCLREGGALGRVDPERGPGFRAFLHGVVRNVARRFEHQRARAVAQAPSDFDPPADDRPLSQAFDRAWARSMMKLAAARAAERAADAGAEAERRQELLRLRFGEGLPIREIARLWEADPAQVHRDYARARREFRAALVEVVGEHQPGTPGEIERECERLVGCLGA